MRRQAAELRHDGEAAAERTRPSVIVAEPNGVVADALTHHLSGTLLTRPFATTLRAVDAGLESNPVDVVLLAGTFPPDESSLPGLREWSRRYPTTKFIVMRGGDASRGPVGAALAVGAHGVVRMDHRDGLAEVDRAVEAVLVGVTYVSTTATRNIEGNGADPDKRFAWAVTCVMAGLGFTRALAEVAVLRHDDFLVKQIAGRLDITEAAVHDRFKRIGRDHGLRGTAALVKAVAGVLNGHRPASP